ncbi:hypothetical protein K504DRAFT_463931 [Pleomassaria siparia CBS 279.74]|uniref:Uncharacterized protein n=1 Tax=Pleomassaria siparia CBS 279.74 TaxID=1314801 RepID=A0A6G1JQJ8_9PLEO|nr:hypothetical protein K504DRAFT_463931 [Pleomassaria siparia CBS 279.74]
MVNTTPHRPGHAGLRAILDDIFDLLPPEGRGNPAYARCRTTYGLMNSFHLKAETSETPTKEYVELQKMESALRQRLLALESTKGVPDRMIKCLDELRISVAEVIDKGWTVLDVLPDVQGLFIDDEEREKQRKVDRQGNKLIPEREVKKVKDKLAEMRKELQAERAKVSRLNEENNNLTMKLKVVTSERDRLLGQTRLGEGSRGSHSQGGYY